MCVYPLLLSLSLSRSPSVVPPLVSCARPPLVPLALSLSLALFVTFSSIIGRRPARRISTGRGPLRESLSLRTLASRGYPRYSAGNVERQSGIAVAPPLLYFLLLLLLRPSRLCHSSIASSSASSSSSSSSPSSSSSSTTPLSSSTFSSYSFASSSK